MNPRHRLPRRLVLGGGLALAVVVPLAACAGPSNGPAASPAKSLVIDMAFDMGSLDPGIDFEHTGDFVRSQIYQTLLTIDPADLTKVVPGLAETYEVSDDAKTFTFHLNKNATFSDGTPVTAADVKFSFERMHNLKGNPSYLMDGITVSAPDPQTVVLTADTSMPGLPAMIAAPNFSVLNSAAVRAKGGTDAETAASTDKAEDYLNATSAGSGPYVLESFARNSQIILKANPKFWGAGKPTYTRLVFRNVVSTQQQALDVQSGSAQVATDISAKQVGELDTSKVTVLSTPAPDVLYLGLTTDPSSPTSNDDFARAIRLGIDYDGLVALAGKDASQAPGLIPRTFLGALGQDEVVKRDVEAAKKALAASGRAGEKVTLEWGSDYKLNGLELTAFAQKIQADLKEVGVDIELKPSPTQVSRTRYREGDFQIAMWPYPPSFADPSQFLVFTPGGTVGSRLKWTEKDAPRIADLGKKAAAAVSAEDRGAAYQEWQRALNASNRYVPLLTPSVNLVVGRRVQADAFNPVLGPYYANFRSAANG